MHGLENEYGDRIRFIYLDVDDPGIEMIASQISNYVIPELFLLDGQGNILNHWLGYTDFSILSDAISNAVTN